MRSILRPQQPERTIASESLSVYGFTEHSDEQSVSTVCEEREGAAAGEEWNDETGSVILSQSTVREQAHGVSGMEWSEHRPERNGTKWRRARWAVKEMRGVGFEPTNTSVTGS